MRFPLPFPPARRFRSWLALPLLLSAALSAHAAGPASAAIPKGTDAFGDSGGFEKVSGPTENLWDGVNSDGTLASRPYSAPVVTERGNFGTMAMPPSVAFADLNGDGKPDLIVADPNGYFRFYPNSGTATEPRFTSAEVMPIFLSTTFKPREFDWKYHVEHDFLRMCPRIALADWRKTGLLDLLVGNYYGEVFFLPNVGTVKAAAYKVPAAGASAALIPTDDQNRYWGNLFAPVAYNWVGGGKPDVILGEGTYSANSIHLLENLGGEQPKFSSAKHTVMIYGDGREQLIPAVADFNGDGNPDVVMADRSGEVGLYLNPGKPAANVELKRTSTLSFGGTTNLGGVTSPCAVDFNGDGLIDLIFGLPSGHIAVSLNTGTATEPKFGPLVELKGTPRLGRNQKMSPGWHTNSWPQYGNALSYITVVNSQDDPDCKPPEGNNCLKAGYSPVPAQTFPMPDTGMPGGSHHFTFFHDNMIVNINKPYKISFKVKGTGMERLHYELQSHFQGFPLLAKLEKDERGGVKVANIHVDEWLDIGGNAPVTPNWTTVEAVLIPKYKTPSMKDETTVPLKFYLDFYSTSLASQIYFDDFHLVEQ